MSDSKYNFQYCQKMIVLNRQLSEVLLAKRKDEADYDGVFSLVGGKMEVSDASIIEAIKREKNEELGRSVKLSLYPIASNNVLFHKADGSSMILPHYLAYFVSGEIELNLDEYSEYRWIQIAKLNEFKPLVENVANMVNWAVGIAKNSQEADFVEI